MNSIRGIGRKRHLATTAAVVMATAGTALFLAPQAKAANGTATPGTGSTQTLTILPNVGLSITASPIGTAGSPVSIGSGVNLGSVVVLDNEADSTDWTASVSASDCTPISLTGNLAGANQSSVDIPATALDLSTGTSGQTQVMPTASPELTGTKAAPAILGQGGYFQAATTSPSNAQTLAQTKVYQNAPGGTATATDAYTNDGTYTLSPSISVNSSAGNFTALGTNYTCTLQYTVSG